MTSLAAADCVSIPLRRSLSANGAKAMTSFRTTATRYLLASPIAWFIDYSRSRMRPPVLLPALLDVNTSRRYSGNFIGYHYVSVFGTGWQTWHSDHYQARCRRILPTIASSLLNSDGEHSDQRNDPSASYNAATTPSATDHSQQPVRVRGTTFLLTFATPSWQWTLSANISKLFCLLIHEVAAYSWFYCAVYKCSYLRTYLILYFHWPPAEPLHVWRSRNHTSEKHTNQ